MKKFEKITYIKDDFFDELNDFIESFTESVADYKIVNKKGGGLKVLKALSILQDRVDTIKTIINYNHNKVIIEILKLESGNTVPTKKIN